MNIERILTDAEKKLIEIYNNQIDNIRDSIINKYTNEGSISLTDEQYHRMIIDIQDNSAIKGLIQCICNINARVKTVYILTEEEFNNNILGNINEVDSTR
jgi:hypothetical protein